MSGSATGSSYRRMFVVPIWTDVVIGIENGPCSQERR